MKKKLDWIGVGQFVAFLMSVFVIIRDTFKEVKVGIEIIQWLAEDGREFFVETLTQLGDKFIKTQRVKVLSDTVIMVNLDVAPKLPFDGAEIEKNEGCGWVKIEKREDGLYVDDRKVVLYLSERQKGGQTIKGYELRDEFTGKLVLHPNILDALMEHFHLIPEDWKKDENGNTRYIFFWAVIFRNSDGDLFVRCLNWDGSRWFWNYRWLDIDFNSDNPAAVCAS